VDALLLISTAKQTDATFSQKKTLPTLVEGRARVFGKHGRRNLNFELAG